ncbi:hypothetical protein [Microbulbifer taiwanensis]|uniref:Lipoprotein n=1 Tax=Microbulbifer taiwanensis TaxID=986746 RepID=A0ABW1YJS2_9GAMM|nr:hypothetical protein [Microbulbifer taiwanensis]
MKKGFLFLLVALISGCTSVLEGWYGETKPMMSFSELSPAGSDGKSPSSRLFVWSPKNSVAFVNQDGSGCIQGAEVFHEKSGNVNVSNELLGVLKGLDVSNKSSEEEKALALTITNEIVSLRNNTERNTYLGIGMFGLCQLQANGGLDTAEVMELTGLLINNAIDIRTPTTPSVPNQDLSPDRGNGEVMAGVE